MRKDQAPLTPHQKFAQDFILLRDKNALKLGETIHALTKYPKPHLCLPWCQCKKLRKKQIILREKIARHQSIIADLEDGIFQPAIDYMSELQVRYQQKQSLPDNIFIIIAGSRFARIVRERRLAELTRQTTEKLSQAQTSAYRRLLSSS